MLRPAFVCLSILFGATEASAAFCVEGHPRVDQEFVKASAVALVVGDHVQENRKRYYVYQKRRYFDLGRVQSVKVEFVFKGSLPSHIAMFDAYDSARFPIDPGVHYVVFFHRRPGASVFIDACGNSGQVSKRRDVLAHLRSLSHSSR